MAYSKYCLEGVINQIPVIFLLDTGAAVSFLRIDLLAGLDINPRRH